MNETNLKKSKELKLKGYKSYNRNRINGHMGGIATSVIDEESGNTLKVTEGKEDNEFLITRHNQFLKPINIINVYGDVESRTPKEVIDAKWDEILQEVVKIEAREEQILILGDLNKHCGSYIKGNHEKVTPGGRRILEFIESGEYVLVNGTEKEVNGLFTRYDPNDSSDETKKSTLDLAIVSRDLYEYIERFEIDKNRNWTPCRSVGNSTIKYTDHYAIYLVFKNIPKRTKKKVSQKPQIIWNTRKEGGWQKYYEDTDENKVLDEAVNENNDDNNKLLNVIAKEMANIKYSCFGKVSISRKSKEEKALQNIQKEKIYLASKNEDSSDVDRKLSMALNKVNRANYEREVDSLVSKLKKKGKAAAVFQK